MRPCKSVSVVVFLALLQLPGPSTALVLKERQTRKAVVKSAHGQPEVKSGPPFKTAGDACKYCMQGHTKNTAMPWCMCLGREKEDGTWGTQCTWPKTANGFYSCVCKGSGVAYYCDILDPDSKKQ